MPRQVLTIFLEVVIAILIFEHLVNLQLQLPGEHKNFLANLLIHTVANFG